MKLSLDINETGIGTVAIDGHNVEQNVMGIDLRSRVGQITQVTLYFGMVAVEGQAESANVGQGEQ
jgi:hypothetical protein